MMPPHSECIRQLVGPDLLKLLYPSPQTVHLDALLAVLHLQLRDGLFLLGAVVLYLLQGGTHQAKLFLQCRYMLLLLMGNKDGSNNCLIIHSGSVLLSRDKHVTCVCKEIHINLNKS